MSDDAEHALLAPSSAPIWGHCAGSVLLSKQYPDLKDEGDEAAEGTAAHWLAQQRLLTGEWKTGKAPNDVPITDDMRFHMGAFTDRIEGLREGNSWYVEMKLVAAAIHPTLCWGTADSVVLDHTNKVAYIDDAKYGWGLHDPYQHYQLVAYGSAVMDFIGPEAIDWTFHLTIVQPRPWHREGPIRTWVVSAPELRNHVRHLRTQAEEATGNNPSTVTGKHCKHCKARRACPALRAATLDILDVVSDATPAPLDAPALALELSLLKQAQERLDARWSGLEAQATAEIRAGKPVPGWSIEHTEGREKWTKTPEEIIAVGSLLGVSLAKSVDVITPAQARKAGMKPELAAFYTERKPGAAKLVQSDLSAARRAFGRQQP